MPKPSTTDEEFAAVWRRFCSASKVAAYLGVSVRSVYERRNSVERRLGIVLPSAKDDTNRVAVSLPKQGYRHILDNFTGIVLVFSDAHFWPGEALSTAFLALIELIKEFKPKAIVCNGDVLDGASISRHPPVSWLEIPNVAEEIATCQERLDEIRWAAPKGCKLYANFGNHDSRFAMRLAAQAPEYVRVHGTDLKHHFPEWSWAWSTMINGHTMVKHRYHSGIHAAHNNVLKSGISIVTGHCHRLQVTAWGDYNGRRYGVDTGTLSEFGHEQEKWTYGEDNPLNWGQGFAVLTFDERGRLLPPELVEVRDGTAYFRGQAVISKSRLKPAKAKKREAA